MLQYSKRAIAPFLLRRSPARSKFNYCEQGNGLDGILNRITYYVGRDSESREHLRRPTVGSWTIF